MAGNPHPVFVDGVAPQKANARAYLPLRLGNPDALRALDGSSFWLCFIHSLRAFFYRDTSDTTSADDGAAVIVDANGGRWKFAGGSGVNINAAGPVASRDAFDAEAPGFTYFGSDTELLYVRLDAGGWSDGTALTGPAGAPAVIAGTSTTSLGIALGEQVFTTQEGIAWPNGTRVRAASAANPATHWMEGVVTAYAGTSLTLAVDKVGAGLGDTRADWNLFITGEPSSVAGADGTDPGLLLNFETGTSAPPSAGAVRANNADLSAATKLYVSKVNRAGSSIAGTLAKLFDAARTRKDSVALTNPADDKQATVQIDGLTDQTGYVEFDISDHDGETAFAAGAISLSPVIAAGDDGADGEGTGDVTAASNIADNALVVGDGGAKGIKAHASGAPGDAAFKNTGTSAGTVAAGDHNHSGVYEPIDAEIVRADTDDNLTAGFTATTDDDGTPTTTYKPTPAGGNFKKIVCGGALEIQAPDAAGDYTLTVKITNNGSAGNKTFSGFTKAPSTAAFTNTNGHIFLVDITKIDGTTRAVVTAMQ